jgi:hypothetical protein
MLAQKLGLSLPTIKTVGAGFENLYSLDFDGVNDALNMGDANVFTPDNSGAGNGFSVSFWIKTTRDRISVLGKGDAVDKMEWIVTLGAGGGTVQFTVFSGGAWGVSQALITNSAAVGDGAWHHVVCTWDLANNVNCFNIFIDGTEYSKALANATYASAGTWSGMTNTTSDLLIGAGVYGGSPYDGQIDEFAIFDDELSASQATSIYNSGTATDLSGETYLLGYWRNGDPTGTGAYPTITDQSSNSNDGTMISMVAADIVTDAP